MKDSDYKRVKHHQFPGDVSRWQKIAMRENDINSPFLNSGKYPLRGNPSKVYRKMVNMKTRAVNKERALKEIEEALEEMIQPIEEK